MSLPQRRFCVVNHEGVTDPLTFAEAVRLARSSSWHLPRAQRHWPWGPGPEVQIVRVSNGHRVPPEWVTRYGTDYNEKGR